MRCFDFWLQFLEPTIHETANWLAPCTEPIPSAEELKSWMSEGPVNILGHAFTMLNSICTMPVFAPAYLACVAPYKTFV